MFQARAVQRASIGTQRTRRSHVLMHATHSHEEAGFHPLLGRSGGRFRLPRNRGVPQGLAASTTAFSEPQDSAYPSGWTTLPRVPSAKAMYSAGLCLGGSAKETTPEKCLVCNLPLCDPALFPLLPHRRTALSPCLAACTPCFEGRCQHCWRCGQHLPILSRRVFGSLPFGGAIHHLGFFVGGLGMCSSRSFTVKALWPLLAETRLRGKLGRLLVCF